MGSFLDKPPVRIGSSEEFACIARNLKRYSYDEETICRLFRLDDLSSVSSINESDVELADASEQFKTLVRIFLLLSFVRRADFERVFDSDTIKSFLSLGLVGLGEFGKDEFYARALLYPVSGFLICSDRHSLPDDSPFEPPLDIVFPAIFLGTLQFLKLLPTKFKGTALDLCSGSGIGALVLSRLGGNVVSSDLTERASTFARFNCALNDVRNVEVVRGDLYEAVEGRSFDCIVAHPPYVPSLEAKTIWRDGGITGEALLKRIVEGLPKHLNPGGTFYCYSLGVDTESAKFEDRVRSWLGDFAPEFDIIFAYIETRDPQWVLEGLAKRYADSDPAGMQQVESEYKRVGVRSMPLGALYLRRSEGSKPHHPLTTRRQLAKGTEGSDLERTFELLDRLADPELLSSLEQSTPRLASQLVVKVTHVVDDGSLVPVDFLFEIDKPFTARVRFEHWMVPLLARLDGKQTVATIYSEVQANGNVPDEFKLQNFAVLIAKALEMGFVEL